MLVVFGICKIIFLENLKACSRIDDNLGTIIESRSFFEYYRILIPPHGGHKIIASVLKGFIFKKSKF